MIVGKIVFASMLLLAGTAALGSMLALRYRGAPPKDPALLRLVHVWAGRAFAAGLAVNTVLGLILLAGRGDGLPLRSVLHWHLALAVDGLVLAKLGALRLFKPLAGRAPRLGFATAAGAALLLAGSLGFAILGGRAPSFGPAASAAGRPIEAGRAVFAGLCAGCHAVEGNAARGGPSLAGLFRRTELPVSGRPATDDAVRLQLKRPFRAMPPFASLSEAEVAALLAYLRSLPPD